MSHSKYGFGCVGNGSGRYHPESKNTPLESAIQTKILKALKTAYPDAVIVNVGAGGYLRSGLPDIMVAYKSTTTWIEVKRPGADTSAIQKEHLENFMSVGHYVGTAESVETALSIMEEVIKCQKAKSNT